MGMQVNRQHQVNSININMKEPRPMDMVLGKAGVIGDLEKSLAKCQAI